VYIDVFTPMPSASVTNATIVKPGVLINWRKAKRRADMEDCRFKIAD